VLTCCLKLSTFDQVTGHGKHKRADGYCRASDDPVNSENSSRVVGVPVDSLISPMLTIAVFKTDTQGFECNVLQGAAHTLRIRRPGLLIVEARVSYY
jgi:FkbM family methyltransferase